MICFWSLHLNFRKNIEKLICTIVTHQILTCGKIFNISLFLKRIRTSLNENSFHLEINSCQKFINNFSESPFHTRILFLKLLSRPLYFTRMSDANFNFNDLTKNEQSRLSLKIFALCEWDEYSWVVELACHIIRRNFRRKWRNSLEVTLLYINFSPNPTLRR